MTAFIIEVFRILKSKWFWLSATITVVTLWAGIGPDSYWLLQGAEMESAWLFQNAFTSSMNAIALPLLAALPGAALVQKEIRSGSVRSILFRVGMRRYLFSRVFSLLLVSVLSQLLGTLCFIIIIGIQTVDFAFPAACLWARLLSATIFAVVGSFGALLTKDTTCAYAIPIALCFALSMLRSRFMVEAAFLDPMCWLTGTPDKLLFMGVTLILLLTGYTLFLCREVKRNV